MKRKVLFVALPLFLFLHACTTTKLSFNQEDIIITSHSNQNTLPITHLIDKDYLKLSNMKIEYHVVQFEDTSIAVLEELEPNTTYMFDGSISKIVSIGFKNYISKQVYAKGDMSFFILREKLDTTKLLYLTLYNRNKKHIKLIYTTDKKLFQTILDNFEMEEKIEIVSQNNIANNLKEKDAKNYIQTSWSEKSLILDGLLKTSYTVPRIVH